MYPILIRPTLTRRSMLRLAGASLLALALAPCQACAGEPEQAREVAEGKVAVWLFVMSDCPKANAYAPELARIARDYEAKGVTTWFVYGDEPEAVIRKHQTDFKLPGPWVRDAEKKLATLAGAEVAPSAAIVTAGEMVRYIGRIDDRIERRGGLKPEAGSHDLRDALDAVLAGKEPARPFPKAIGCYL